MVSAGKKDIWDILSSLSAIFATVVLGTAAFIYTNVVAEGHRKEESARSLQLQQTEDQFNVETEHRKEAEDARAEEWKETQDRLAEQDRRSDEFFKKTQDENSKLQMFTQLWTLMADKDDPTRQAYLAALHPLVGKSVAEAAQMMMIEAKRTANVAVAAVGSATTPEAEERAVHTLSGALSLGNTLADNASTFANLDAPRTSEILTARPTFDWAAVGIVDPPRNQSFDFTLPSASSSLIENGGTPNSPVSLLGLNSSSGSPYTFPSGLAQGSDTGSLSGSLSSQLSSFSANSIFPFTSDSLRKEVDLSIKLKDSVVRIVSGAGKDLREGSGFFVSDSGLVLSVAAAITSTTQPTTVVTADGTSRVAKVLWRDDGPEGLALLRTDASLAPIPAGEASSQPEALYVVGSVSRLGTLATRANVSMWSPSDFTIFGLTLAGYRGSPIVDQGGALIGILLDDHEWSASSRCKRVDLQAVLAHAR